MGRPRTSPALIARIIQIRASNPESPPSIDRIVDLLSLEVSKGLWEHLPGRGTVQNVVRRWEDRPEEVRHLDMPFEWHRLGRARIPWEASGFVLKCKYEYDSMYLTAAKDTVIRDVSYDFRSVLENREPFTNRWSSWCWRLHCAAPDLSLATSKKKAEKKEAEQVAIFVETAESHAMAILSIAERYVHEEQVLDLVPGYGGMEVADLDDFLIYRPDTAVKKGNRARLAAYKRAIEAGLARDMQDPLEDVGGTIAQTVKALGPLLEGGLAMRTALSFIRRFAVIPEKRYKDSKNTVEDDNERSHRKKSKA